MLSELSRDREPNPAGGPCDHGGGPWEQLSHIKSSQNQVNFLYAGSISISYADQPERVLGR
jgi:hypothetical protein